MTEPKRTIGIVLFDRAEELDWVGPFEVFTMAREASGKDGPASGLEVVLVSERGGIVKGAKGLRNEVDCAFAEAPALDVLLVPGGIGTRDEMKNPTMLDFLRKQAEGAEWVTSVCTGSAVLEAAGLTRGRKITTHGATCRPFARTPARGPRCSNACATCATGTCSRPRASRRASTPRSGWWASSTACPMRGSRRR